MATKKTPVKKTPAGKNALTVQDVKPKRETPKRDPFYDAPESIDAFCAYISQGGHLVGFQRERGLAYTTLADWVHNDPDRKARYERARESRADVLADEIVSISDETHTMIEVQETTPDGLPVFKEDGTPALKQVRVPLSADVIARNRLRVDTRKWAAAKLKPRVYGDKVTQEHTGADGGAIKVETMNLKHLSDTELEAMRTLMLKANGAA